ncbi:D-amino acid dehydrogenase [Shinella sp.]|uniref:D-amino acid dehydrogenase n=1 Tax=Shinella sp. TaxID=1870904 RepID=UPI003F70E2D4
MKIGVLGGGVIGVTTAYYLARAGHEVELIERRSGVGEETSFANAGQVSPGYSSPWAGPGIPLKAIKWLTMQHGPLAIRPKLDPDMWRWLFSLLRNCTSARYALNKSRMVPLAEYSRDCLRALRADIDIAYDEQSLGTLQLFRTQQQLDAVAKDIEVLREIGVAYEVLTPKGCRRVEPGLEHATVPITGGLRLPGDETGDCKKFTDRLAVLAGELGVKFCLDTTVTGLTTGAGRVTSVMTSRGSKFYDACVVALGCATPALLKPHGMHLPVYPIKGYSLTLPVRRSAAAPISTVMDETYKTAITRLGDRIRVGGTAEVSGFDMALRPVRRRALEHSFTQLFPEGGNISEASFWSGLRPMTPDGPPIIGATPVDNLFVNTGHGTLGWTMACGSADVVADMVSGRKPAISIDGLALSRYA